MHIFLMYDTYPVIFHRSRYFPINVPKSINPTVAHWTVNKNKLLNQKGGDGKVLRVDEKTIEEMERLILQFTEEGDLVMDCFAGTGTTGAACAKLNRRFIGYFISSYNLTCILLTIPH